jgi:hypothetical protein
MVPNLFYKLVDEIEREDKAAILLPFWRGESCLHPQFSELLSYALDKGLRVHLSTNGHFIYQEFLEIFYRCEFLTVSVHTRRGFANARKLARGKPSWSNAIIQVSFVDTEKSASSFLFECINRIDLGGFDTVRLYVEHTVDGVFGKLANPLAGERIFCPKLNDTLMISADGYYSRCSHIWVPELTPNLNQSTIREVWRGKCLEDIRNSYPDEQCMPCDQWRGHSSGEVWQRNNGRVIHISYGL